MDTIATKDELTREDVLVSVLVLVLRPLPLLPREEVLALLLLQCLELLPEASPATCASPTVNVKYRDFESNKD